MTSTSPTNPAGLPSDQEALTPTHPKILTFLTKANKALNTTFPAPADIFSFGDSNKPATKSLNRKAILRLKTGTMTFPVPKPRTWKEGDISIGLDENGEPEFVMRTITLVKKKFEDVGEEFAASEAEGSYEQWRDGHIEFYKGRKDHDGRIFGDGVGKVVLCERFEVLWPFKPDSE